MKSAKKHESFSAPFSTFFVIHFEVGGDTRRLEYQNTFWPATVDLIKLADRYDAKLTLQFTPQWAEYILNDRYKFNLFKGWQRHGHEAGLHHHGYDHRDWDGYTNRRGKENNSSYRGNVTDMINTVNELIHPYQILTGTITDEAHDYPDGIKYDTQGIKIRHSRTRPKNVTLNGKNVIQTGMSILSDAKNIKELKKEYHKSADNEIFGVVTHEIDFENSPEIIKEWFRFVKYRDNRIQTVSEIISNYRKDYNIECCDKPLTFSKDVTGIRV
ncbi:MAG: hypothetical protein HY035_07580 [Nitrospirae bacterium]|nr:hypothetical protein [Nitrospirota bacterium]